jgi:two-component system NtrC family sensor kinase
LHYAIYWYIIKFVKLYRRSLRQKVVVGYLIGLGLMLLVAVINSSNLNRIEALVVAGERVSDLFDTTLEIRRFEKNYFLYQQHEDYAELIGYLNKAEAILDYGADFELYASAGAITELKENIKDYRNLLGVITTIEDKVIGRMWEDRLRNKGKAIVQTAEEISKTERKIMQENLDSSRRVLIWSIMLLIFSGFIAGPVFNRLFIKPLSMLESHMKDIAEGKFSLIPIESRDREIVSLNSAFNRMLLELEARQSHLVQSEKLASLGTLLFGVAHELNNPLSNISTSCQILREEFDEADLRYKKELLAQIEDETDRAKDIVRSLLDFSRGKDREAVNLGQAVGEALRLIRGEVPTKAELSVDIPPDITVFADKQKIQQVIINLMKNSISAIGDEGGISISARRNQKEGSVDIRFADTGAGMEHETLSRIFDPFFTTRETRKGYGLGLFIVHNIIEEHNGSIKVESTPGHGTTFYIKLPERSARNAEQRAAVDSRG